MSPVPAIKAHLSDLWEFAPSESQSDWLKDGLTVVQVARRPRLLRTENNEQPKPEKIRLIPSFGRQPIKAPSH
jgi:hypothetical protein